MPILAYFQAWHISNFGIIPNIFRSLIAPIACAHSEMQLHVYVDILFVTKHIKSEKKNKYRIENVKRAIIRVVCLLCRYIAEVQETEERKKTAELALKAYQKASESAATSLVKTHPIRLGQNTTRRPYYLTNPTTYH